MFQRWAGKSCAPSKAMQSSISTLCIIYPCKVLYLSMPACFALKPEGSGCCQLLEEGLLLRSSTLVQKTQLIARAKEREVGKTMARLQAMFPFIRISKEPAR